jgi:LAS superfamily LD-carboxypeptidase LdcB
MLVWAPLTASAAPVQEPPPGTSDGPTLDIDVDVASADIDDVEDTLGDLVDNVKDQLDDLDTARDDLADAEDDVTDAQDAVAATETRITGLTEVSDTIVTNTFVNPPNVANTDTLSTPTLGDLAVKQTLLTVRADDEGDVLDELADARDDLEDQQETEEVAAADATTARDDAVDNLEDAREAVGQQAAFVGLVEERLERGAGESVSLAGVDPDLASALEDDQDALADALQGIIDDQELADALDQLAEAQEQLEAEQAAEDAAAAAAAAEAAEQEEAAAEEDPPDLGAPSGGLATVDCPSGGSITVDSSISGNLSSMLSAASGDGVSLCGGGYRDPQEQIALREQNCGTDYYSVYEAPASSCSPPTARPGTSNHEQGLAVDFENCSSQSTACYGWLANNASSYGFYNLPSEPWHWSVDGT